ncbi:MAG: hypothetical protein H6Q53_82, partial [Deltaproteobacteria bacterium]|nr:hypothetical protein [Deltaproteobacteria bacterium]
MGSKTTQEFMPSVLSYIKPALIAYDRTGEAIYLNNKAKEILGIWPSGKPGEKKPFDGQVDIDKVINTGESLLTEVTISKHKKTLFVHTFALSVKSH